MMKVRSERVWLNGRFVPATLCVEAERIERVEPYAGAGDAEDFGNLRVVPGFIDIHTHGAYGFDANSADAEGLRRWTARLPEEGVTTFLPTLAADTHDVLVAALASIAAVRGEHLAGADILGVHLEGPYVDARYPGARPLDAIAEPSIPEFDEFQRAAQGLIRVMTMAPEHDEGFALTRHCAQEGVVISMGHTSATFEQAALAAANGARSITHAYNAMSPFTHRANGVVGAALRLDGLFAEAICDCHHSTPEALNLFFRAKGKDFGVMITDSVMCKGYEPGTEFEFVGKQIIIAEDGCPHLVEGNNFAGSTLKMNVGLRNLVEEALVPFDAAINACTANPARLLGEDGRLGSLGAGHDADIVVLDDAYEVVATYCKGARVR